MGAAALGKEGEPLGLNYCAGCRRHLSLSPTPRRDIMTLPQEQTPRVLEGDRKRQGCFRNGKDITPKSPQRLAPCLDGPFNPCYGLVELTVISH